MALVFLAKGGVTLGGGILPRVIGLLDPDDFRQSFEAKAPMQALVRSISTQVVVQEDAVLAGMADMAADPRSYRLDYASRLWC
jgi:glucokinase